MECHTKHWTPNRIPFLRQYGLFSFAKNLNQASDMTTISAKSL